MILVIVMMMMIIMAPKARGVKIHFTAQAISIYGWGVKERPLRLGGKSANWQDRTGSSCEDLWWVKSPAGVSGNEWQWCSDFHNVS